MVPTEETERTEESTSRNRSPGEHIGTRSKFRPIIQHREIAVPGPYASRDIEFLDKLQNWLFECVQ